MGTTEEVKVEIRKDTCLEGKNQNQKGSAEKESSRLCKKAVCKVLFGK